MSEAVATRPLTKQERELAQWMLENGHPEGRRYLGQLARAEATTWRCECGCATFYFSVGGEPVSPPRVLTILADFLGFDDQVVFGAFINQGGGMLDRMEIYGLSEDAPKSLPRPEQLRPIEEGL